MRVRTGRGGGGAGRWEVLLAGFCGKQNLLDRGKMGDLALAEGMDAIVCLHLRRCRLTSRIASLMERVTLALKEELD